MLRRRRCLLLAASLLVAAPVLPVSPPEAAADHGAADHGAAAVEEVGAAVTEYEHFNPWFCTNPPSVPFGEPPLCEWNGEWFPFGEQRESSCIRTIPPGLVIAELQPGDHLGEVSNGYCGHSSQVVSGTDHWSFGGDDHADHRNVVTGTASRYRCTLAGWDSELQYDADGHPLGHDGPSCGTWTPTVNITGAAVVEGQEAVLSVEASSGFNGGFGSVSFETVAGSATAGDDFGAVSGTKTFNDGGLSREVIVETFDDDAVEASETFSVELFDPQGVLLGVSAATVAIIDNDSAPDDPDDPDDPDEPQPQPPQAGCDAADARLASLSVTVSGSELLDGFSPGTFSYSVTVDSVSALVSATAASPTAMVQIGAGGSGTGSAAQTVYTSQGSTVTVDVVVSSAGESCTYNLAVSRPAPPVTDCPANSGLELVNGVCVEACPGSDTIPQFDSEGQVTGCVLVTDCPYDLYGLDTPPAEPYRDYDALWLAGPDAFGPLAAGETASVTRTAVKCAQLFLADPTTWPSWPNDVHVCIWDESNLKSSGDCLHLVLSVEAVIPAVQADTTYRNWSFKSEGCSNASAPRVESTTDPWTPADAACESTAGSWVSSSCFGCSSTAPANDPGVWTVEVLDDALTSPGSGYAR